MSTRIRALAGLAALAIVVAACGGSASPAPSSAGGTAPAATATPAPTEGAATAAPTAEPTAAPTTAGGVPDITTGAAALSNLDSYRMKVTMGMKGLESSVFSAFGDGLAMDALVVLKPEKAADMKISMGTADQKLEMGYRLIGDKAWINLGGDSWMESTAEDAQATMDSFAPEKMFGGLGSFSGMSPVGEETKNGVATTHYSASGADVAGMLNDTLGLANGTWTVDYWVAKDGGYPVAYTVEGKGASDAFFNMALEVSDINNAANKIEVPTVN
jgi:hypothetical protein